MATYPQGEVDASATPVGSASLSSQSVTFTDLSVPLSSTTSQTSRSDKSTTTIIIPITSTVTESVRSISSSVNSATSSSSTTSTSSQRIASTSFPKIISPSFPRITSTLSPSITSTSIATTSTIPPVRKLSESAKAGLAVGVAIVLLLIGIALVDIFWRRRTHRKHAGYDSRISEGLDLSFSQLEVAERSHELGGGEIVELGGSTLHSPAEIDGAEAATASTKTNIQNSTIASKSDRESHLLPEAIHENRGTQTRNSAGKQAPSGRETKPNPRARKDELNRLEAEERRIGKMLADAERLERIRNEYSAIQDRIRQVKEG